MYMPAPQLSVISRWSRPVLGIVNPMQNDHPQDQLGEVLENVIRDDQLHGFSLLLK